MSHGLSRLPAGDPQQLLSIEARKRIQRAFIDAEKHTWQTEITIRERGLDPNSRKAEGLRSKAALQRAKVCLSAYHREFSRIHISEREYRQFMRDEIEAASNSFGLSDFHTRLLETEFFFPAELKISPQLEKSADEGVIDRRQPPRALYTSYIARFPNEKIKIRDLCWAAKQHYREWKRWLACELKEGSTPDLAFRRVLSSHKRPSELVTKRRPPGWE